MKKDEFTKRVTSKRDQLAKEQHHKKNVGDESCSRFCSKETNLFYSI